jgi:hypothetical protein
VRKILDKRAELSRASLTTSPVWWVCRRWASHSYSICDIPRHIYRACTIGACKAVEEPFVLTNLNAGRILEGLSSVGATSARLLTEGFRLALAIEW